MKTKKIPYYILLLLLTVGASLIIGLLSFGGMFALWPIIPLACSAFILSVAYEGEIYLQNIKGALSKLFKPNFLKRQLANEYLLAHFPEDTAAKDCPEFFRDYERQLHLLHQFSHTSPDKTPRRLDKKSVARKKKIEKTLRDMEKWFATTLFAPELDKLTKYEKELRQWLMEHNQAEWREKFNKRQTAFSIAFIGSVIAGICMGLGTSYLLVETFTLLPFLAVIPIAIWPALIIPMALVAGAAYGLLTYNAVTDMISNDTLRKWYNNIRSDLKQGLTFRNVSIAVAAVALFALTLALTICTAGTWWTVVKQTRPVLSWMRKLPVLITQLTMSLVIGISAFIFNIENTLETLGLIRKATAPRTPEEAAAAALRKEAKAQQKNANKETWWQVINPFRLLLKVTVTPLRILFFLGHLISIGVTTDRVPGIPEIVSALLGIISEGFEDAHYFADSDDAHDHGHDTKSLLKERLSEEHSHSHEQDIPTRILKFIFYPVYCLAALWDSRMSQRNAEGQPSLNYQRALEKQMGIAPEEAFKLSKESVSPSREWQGQHIIYLLDRQKSKLPGTGIAEEKRVSLTILQEEVREGAFELSNKQMVKQRIDQEKDKKVHNTHRNIVHGQKTNTHVFLNQLYKRTASPTSVVGMPFEEDLEKDVAKLDCKPNCPDCRPSFSFAAAIAKVNAKKKQPPANIGNSPPRHPERSEGSPPSGTVPESGDLSPRFLGLN
jgi:hypothetical protein